MEVRVGVSPTMIFVPLRSSTSTCVQSSGPVIIWGENRGSGPLPGPAPGFCLFRGRWSNEEVLGGRTPHCPGL